MEYLNIVGGAVPGYNGPHDQDVDAKTGFNKIQVRATIWDNADKQSSKLRTWNATEGAEELDPVVGHDGSNWYGRGVFGVFDREDGANRVGRFINAGDIRPTSGIVDLRRSLTIALEY